MNTYPFVDTACIHYASTISSLLSNQLQKKNQQQSTAPSLDSVPIIKQPNQDNQCKIQQDNKDIYKFTQNSSVTQQIRNIKIQDVNDDRSHYRKDIFYILQAKIFDILKKDVFSQKDFKKLKNYRKQKSQLFLQKKRNRNWQKKILYMTRKIVADRRIRFQGKFISEQQAKKILNIQDNNYSFQQLKQMMISYKLKKHQINQL